MREADESKNVACGSGRFINWLVHYRKKIRFFTSSTDTGAN